MIARLILPVLLVHVLLTKGSAYNGSVSDTDSQQTRYNRLRAHSWSWSWFDKPTAHPTTFSYHNSPYHYGSYGNNNQHPYDYYTYSYVSHGWSNMNNPTYSPTSTPTFNNKVPTYMPTQTLQDTRQHMQSASPSTSPSSNQAPITSSQDIIVHEHFLDGFGVFLEQESPNTHHYQSVLGRQGVVELKRSSTLSSYNIAIDFDASQQLSVAFSFYSECNEICEGFCLEYSVNDDVEWNPVRCWQTSLDFENNSWNDEISTILNLDDSRIQVDSIRIKFETIANGDDASIKFDRISLLKQ